MDILFKKEIISIDFKEFLDYRKELLKKNKIITKNFDFLINEKILENIAKQIIEEHLKGFEEEYYEEKKNFGAFTIFMTFTKNKEKVYDYKIETKIKDEKLISNLIINKNKKYFDIKEFDFILEEYLDLALKTLYKNKEYEKHFLIFFKEQLNSLIESILKEAINLVETGNVIEEDKLISLMKFKFLGLKGVFDDNRKE